MHNTLDQKYMMLLELNIGSKSHDDVVVVCHVYWDVMDDNRLSYTTDNGSTFIPSKLQSKLLLLLNVHIDRPYEPTI